MPNNDLLSTVVRGLMFSVFLTCVGGDASAQQGHLTHASPDDPLLQSLPLEARKHYVVTPGGVFYEYCLLQEGDVKRPDGSIQFADGTIVPAGPCPYSDFRVGHFVPVEK